MLIQRDDKIECVKLVELGLDEEDAARITNDISEDICPRATKADLCAVIWYWAHKASTLASELANVKTKKLIRELKSIVDELTNEPPKEGE